MFTAEEYLQRIRKTKERIESKREMLARTRQLATKTTQTLTKDKIQSGNAGSRVEQNVEKILELETYIQDSMDKLIDQQMEAMELINKITDSTLASLLENYYVSCLSLEKTAEKMNYSVDWIKSLKRRALFKFQDILEETQHQKTP